MWQPSVAAGGGRPGRTSVCAGRRGTEALRWAGLESRGGRWAGSSRVQWAGAVQASVLVSACWSAALLAF